MDIKDLIRIAIIVSIALIVLSFALLSSWREATSLFRKPALLMKSLLAMNVLLPIFMAGLLSAFSFRPPVAIALMALAASSVPPFLPLKQRKLVGANEYIYGLLGADSLLAIVIVPLTVALYGLEFSRAVHVSPLAIARVVAITVLLPFAIGLIVAHRAPTFAVRASPLASKTGMLMLLIAVIPVVITMWRGIASLIGDGTLLAIVAFVIVGLAIGHVCGGPSRDNRSVLALATATRHPGIALAITTANFPNDTLVVPALILYLVVCTIVTIPYLRWHASQHKGGSEF
jgi:bile acid:Na+ symporter, BASS family